MINRKIFTIILGNNIFLTKCETIEFSLTNKNLEYGSGISFKDGKWILSIGCFKNLDDFKNTMNNTFVKNRLKINSITVNIKKDKDIVELKDKEKFVFANKKTKNINSNLYNIIIDFENTDKKNYKINFDKDNFYDKDYFIGENLTKLKEELVNLNGKEMPEDDLNKKINELKETYLKKPDSDYYDIINIEKNEKNINIIKSKDVYFGDVKDLFNKNNYVFLLKEYEDEKAPDYCEPFNKAIYNFFKESSDSFINKDEYFFYYKRTVDTILSLIIDRLRNYSDRNKKKKVPYNFEIELLDISTSKAINPSDSILEAGKYYIKIKDLFITNDQNQNVKDLNKLIEDLEKKSKEAEPFDIAGNGNKYITEKQTNFNNLKSKLEKIEFCKLFLEEKEDLFNNYINSLNDKIKLLNLSEDVKKIINEINQQINNFKEEIKTWKYDNFSNYLDENKNIIDKKVKEYIESIINKEKAKNDEEKQKKVTEYYDKNTLNNNISSVKIALNTRLKELKYSINLVIRGNKKFKNNKFNTKFNEIVNEFKENYYDFTFNELLQAHIIGHVLIDVDNKATSNTKFYVNNTQVTNLKDIIAKNSTVEIDFDSSLYIDKKDEKTNNGDEKDNIDSNNENDKTEGKNKIENNKKLNCNSGKYSGNKQV